MTKYHYIEQELSRQITNGQFAPGDKFYSENELKAKFNVSSITVIKALNALVNRGLLVRYQGKGSYVSKARQGKLAHVTDFDVNQNGELSIKVLNVQTIGPNELIPPLHNSHEKLFYFISRLRLLNDKPIMLSHSYIPQKLINSNTLTNYANFTSIYARIKNDTGIDLFKAQNNEEISICLENDSNTINLLNIATNFPTVFTRRSSYLSDGSLAEYVESYKLANYFALKIENII
jgi:DNA-binding GntR family transcriptional regulator